MNKDNEPIYVAADGVSVCGLTTRELFAAMAMQGFAANTHVFEEWVAARQAKEAVELADALIAELNKPKGA